MTLGTFLAVAWLLTGLGGVPWIATDVPKGTLSAEVLIHPGGRVAVFVSVVIGVLLGPVTLLWWLRR